MRKILAAIAIILALYQSGLIYPTTLKIDRIDRVNHIVTCVNYAGFEYAFEEDDDWEEGDFVSAIMCSNGTNYDSTDDIIIVKRYARIDF